ncbi:MAG TPA: hypothetical protein VG456_04490 [Candidatus Sulfopaludibacter sp.]|jgi:hypothetical protein|nr:hypothetical protein [Candidatus Sulfopaludibacter sp.]
MKTIVAILLSCAALCCAQESTTPQQEPPAANVKRLQSVTWDLATHKLIWIVEKGSVVDGEFVPQTKVKYEVAPDEAFMAYAGEKRPVSEEEAASLHHLLDTLSLYCVESVVWWDHSGEPASPEPTRTKPQPTPASKTVKVAAKMQ